MQLDSGRLEAIDRYEQAKCVLDLGLDLRPEGI